MSDWIGSRRLDVEMIDGTKYAVVTVYADGVAYEMTAAKHNWPAAHNASMHALGFACWHALRRAGEIEKTVTYENFRDNVLQVRPIREDGDPVRPTLPGQLPG
jgi:hypothetical protein